VPVFEHSQESYDKLHADYKAATKEELPAPINYSEQALKGLKAFQTRLKGREQELKEQKEFAQIGETEARTKYVGEQIKTEPFQRANLAASAAKSRADIQKNVYEVAKQIREEARTQGGYDPELARKVDADLIKTTSEAATSARSGETVLNQLETILKNKDTSKFKSLYTAAGAFAGIGNKKNIADYQSARSLTVKLATESLKMMGGNDSNTDVALQMNAAPGYDKPWVSNKIIIQNQKAGFKMAAQIPTFIAEWRRKNVSTINPDRETGQTYQEAFNEWQGKKYEEFGGKYTEKADNATQNQQQPRVRKYNPTTGGFE
jgi:hypothetical protein